MSEIAKVAQRRLNKRAKEAAASRVVESIADVYRICSRHLDPPEHLAPYVHALEDAAFGRTQGVELTFHAPPQHGKSECAKHAFILAAIVRPRLRHVYATYNAERALNIRNQVSKLALEAGLDPHTSDGNLFLSGGTEIRFVGRGTALTGYAADGLVIVDDILKDRAEAVSPTIRDTCWDWFVDVAQTRRHPGSSAIVMNTRWSLDDLIGRLVTRWGWPFVRLAAECDSEDDPLGRAIGEALWPSKRPSEWLQQHKRSPLTWSALYQGRPRPLGDALFQSPTYYDTLPAGLGYRTMHGVDLAYTGKTRADWSVLLRGRLYRDGNLYLTDMMRDQIQADKFTARMAAKIQLEPGPTLWFGNTIERGMAPLIQQQIRQFFCLLAAQDKYVRALPTAEQLWNPGKLLVPRGRTWTQEFVQEVTEFTGQEDPHDDQVDALAALGHLAINGAATAGIGDLNAQIKGAMRGHLRAVS
jgi:predicted phage terminase large subunit-like protein